MSTELVTQVPQKMSIHEKLSRMQLELSQSDLKKSGYNQYSDFHYFELEDILPPILNLCVKYECTIYFVFLEDYALLRIKNWKDDKEITTRVSIPKLETLPRMNIVQSEGSYETYLKRYLLMNLFCITESDVIDSLEYNTESKTDNKSANSTKHDNKSTIDNQSTNSTKQAQSNGKPECWEKVLDYIHKKDPDMEITNPVVNNISAAMFRKDLLSKDERGEILNYIRSQK